MIKPRRKFKDYNKPFSVIIPCYNEESRYLLDCVNSIIKAEGNKQIILVNNNSNKEETLNAINEIKRNKNVLVLNEKRQGKRFAHSKGLKYAKHELVVFVDSDTIVLKESFLELIKPFQDKSIGGVCGNIKIANVKDNFFVKCLDSMYWNSFESHRKSTSNLGFLYVCSGALSCYRKDSLLKLEDKYLNQTFMGRPCSISDDAFMTVRVQSQLGKKIYFQSKAIGLTYSPNKFKGFWKQLERWRRGFLRESLLMWKEPKKNIKLLFLDSQFNFFTQTIMAFFKIALLINLIIFFSLGNLASFFLWFILIASLHSVYLFVYSPKRIPNILAYSFLYEFIFIFTYFHALINIRNQGSWSTR
ncbi:MAG: glycosyltransferase [Nanoarchaeota archaeon]